MNYLTCKEGNSDKFYEISAVGTNVMMRYGKTGTDGVSSVKSFPSSAEAGKFVDKTVKEKVKKGYSASSVGGKRAAEKSAEDTAAPAKKGKSTKAVVTVPVVQPKASSKVSATKVRYLTCTEGNSDKFYEVTQSGSELTFRYGKSGTSGITSTKSFKSEAEATKAADKTVAEKVKKGYEEGEGDEVCSYLC